MYLEEQQLKEQQNWYKPGTSHEEVSNSETDKCLDRFDKIRNSSGSTKTSELRLKCKKQCNQNVQYLEQKKH